MKVLNVQSCPTLRNPMDCSLPGSSDLGILQARIPGWVDISFSRGFSRPRDETWVSCIQASLVAHRTGFDPWGWSIGRRKWLPTPVFLPGEFHGQRSLVGYSALGRKELDTTKWLTLSLSTIRNQMILL